MNLEEMTLDVEQQVEVQGSPDEVFKSVLNRFGNGLVKPDGEPLNMNIEAFAGGRWYRDLGDGTQYLWGHVQVIKAPTLLELSGPMFMSYPAINHVEIKLEPIGDVTKLTLRHRAIGLLDPVHKENVTTGWNGILAAVRSDFAKVQSSPA